MDKTNEKKKVIFSGIQPSGNLTIGNYIGAVKNWMELQEEYYCYFCVVDLHAITVRQVPADLRKRTREVMAIYLAAGISPEKNVMFVQSHVPAHAELAWVLNCYTMFGELSRMTQFKDKSRLHSDNINAGLFTYPVLMAADILLYQTDLVPTGQDQKQHIELARDIANRFNAVYSPTFVEPQPYIPKATAKIMSLADPTRKMSKSDPNGSVGILDTRDEIIRKIKRAVTDSDTVVCYGEGKDGINNLLNIYTAFSGKTPEEAVKDFEGVGYGVFKEAVAETVADSLKDLQARFKMYMDDKDFLDSLMKKNAEIAYSAARKTLSKVYRKIGFYQP